MRKFYLSRITLRVSRADQDYAIHPSWQGRRTVHNRPHWNECKGVAMDGSVSPRLFFCARAVRRNSTIVVREHADE